MCALQKFPVIPHEPAGDFSGGPELGPSTLVNDVLA